ncbi:MAG: hypothetical protein IKF06_02765 [Lachnospiraceae bacterium]|nr:hypothetical protein [Lachnospiraceae bacterium]
MKKTIQYFLLILLIFGELLFSACINHNEPPSNEIKGYSRKYELIEDLNQELKMLICGCLDDKEMGQMIYEFEEIEKKWEGEEGEDGYKIPDLILVADDISEYDDNTRYHISVLEKDDDGLYKGIKISKMEDTSGCKIDKPEDTAVGLPAKEIEGAYTCASVLKVNMKGKDEDEPWTEIYSEEFTFTYNVSAVDEKTLRIDIETTKFGEGPYDPATGICEFKIAPEFYEAMPNAKNDGLTRRFTFSRKGDKIQLEGIVVGNEDDDSVTVGIKEE